MDQLPSVNYLTELYTYPVLWRCYTTAAAVSRVAILDCTDGTPDLQRVLLTLGMLAPPRWRHVESDRHQLCSLGCGNLSAA